MRNSYSTDIVVTATLRSDGTGKVTVVMGNPENVVESLGALIEACKTIQSRTADNNSYAHYDENSGTYRHR